MSVTVVGGFLVVHEQHSVAVSQIKRLQVMGREDPDRPAAREVQLAVDLGQQEAQVILGRFKTFRDAETEMLAILRKIEDSRPASEASVASLSQRLLAVETQVHDMDQLGPVR